MTFMTRQRLAVQLRGAVGLALFGAGGLLPESAARQATPTPAPIECTVEPLSIEEVRASAARAEAASDEFVTMPTLPVGNPAAVETRQAIDLAVHEIEACINAGDLPRLYALFSDALIFNGESVDERRLLVPDDPVAQPRELEDRALFIGPWDTQSLADGRVMAAVRLGNAREFSPDGDETRILIFVQHDGRWLLDEIIDSVTVPGRRQPRLVGNIFGTPLQTPNDEG